MAFLRNRRRNEPQPPPPEHRRGRRRREHSQEPARVSPRLEEEKRRQRLAFTIGGMLIAVIVAIVAVGYFQEFYRPPRVMAGQVRDERFTMGDLVERIRILQGINRYQGGFVDLSVVPFQYLQDMLHAEILRQAAPGLGISITDQDVENFLRDPRSGFYPQKPPGQEADPGQLEREFQSNYTNFLTQVRLSDAEFRVIVRETLARSQLFALLSSSIQETQEQVEVEWIRLELGGNIIPQDVRARLEEEEFKAVAAEVGQSTGFANAEGYVGWVPKGAFPRLDGALFGDPENDVQPLEVGEISQPVVTQEGVYIIHKLSAPEERELSDNMFAKLGTERVKEWQSQQLTQGTGEGWVRINFDSDRYAWVADQVKVTAPRTANNQFQREQAP